MGCRTRPFCTYHGIVIPLSHERYEPERDIETYAAYNATSAASAEAECTGHLKPNYRVLHGEKFTLARQPGFRVVFVEPADPTTSEHTTERVCFLRTLRDPNYTYLFSLHTPSRLYEADRQTFEAVLNSLTWTKPVW